MTKLIFGIGIDDSDYVVRKVRRVRTPSGRSKTEVLWMCPFYSKWLGVLHRAGCASYKARDPWYEGVTVCEEWKLFSNFKAWMQTQDWEGKELDKDIILEGNKEYSPANCAFVYHSTNTFLSHKANQKHPQGVTWDRRYKNFIARCSDESGKRIRLGSFSCQYEAHLCWAKYKESVAKLIVQKENDNRIRLAILERCAMLVMEAERMFSATQEPLEIEPLWEIKEEESSKYIKHIRKNILKISQKEAATYMAGVTQTNFSRYELGRTPPPRSLLLLFAVLEQNPELLVHFKNHPPYMVA